MHVTRHLLSGAPWTLDAPIEVLNEQPTRLLRDVLRSESDALSRARTYLHNVPTINLHEAQVVVARECGFLNWSRLQSFFEARDEVSTRRTNFRTSDQPDYAYLRPVPELIRRMAELLGTVTRATLHGDSRPPCCFCLVPGNKVVAGNGVWVCEDCVRECIVIHSNHMQPRDTPSDVDEHHDWDDRHCDFCYLQSPEVEPLFGGCGSTICHRCSAKCQRIMDIPLPNEK